jgi:glutaredoxin 3
MPKIEIYSTRICPYCVRAKKLFEKKGVEVVEIDVSDDEALRNGMIERAGGKRSVPQIFINDQHVGGCDDLYALESKGQLDSLLVG